MAYSLRPAFPLESISLTATLLPMPDDLSATKKSLIFWAVLIVTAVAVYFVAEAIR
jgi:hypothetical protein